MKRMNKFSILWGAIFLFFQCSNMCCQQSAVSFDRLFPDSLYKQMLYVYMNVWARLCDAQLSPAERCKLQTFIYSELRRMNKPATSIKDAYLFRLLMRILSEEQGLFIQAQ